MALPGLKQGNGWAASPSAGPEGDPASPGIQMPGEFNSMTRLPFLAGSQLRAALSF